MFTLSASVPAAGVAAAYAGVSRTAPLDGPVVTRLDFDNTIDVPSLTTTVPGTRVIAAVTNNGSINNPGGWSFPQAMTSRVDRAGVACIADLVAPAAGKTPALVATSASGDGVTSAVFALAPR